MLDILLYAICAAAAGTAITCVLAEPGKPFWYVKKWLEAKYGYRTEPNPIAEPQKPAASGKIDRTKPDTFTTHTASAKLIKRPTFWIYEMLGACTVCTSGQLAFWVCGINATSEPQQVGILLAIFATYLLATLTLKNKAVSAAIFMANLLALGWLIGWQAVAQLPLLLGTSLFFAAVFEKIYTHFLTAR